MSELAESSCEACRIGAPHLTDDELASMQGDIPDWEVIEANGEKQLTRQFKFKNFLEAIEFANLVGEAAEKEGHHPALLVEWGKVTVNWWTHKIGGLHKNDVVMAAKTDCLYPEYK